MVHPLLKNTRVLILLVALALALLFISPSSQEGVAIRGIESGSAAELAGITSPAKHTKPLDYEVITHVDGTKIEDTEQFYTILDAATINETLTIKTDEGAYFVTVLPEFNVTYTGETKEETVNITEEQDINGTLQNVTQEVTRTINITQSEVIGRQDPGISVSAVSQTNLRKGLDLQGGVRVLLSPEENVERDVLERVKEGLEQRLNAFGLNDVVIRIASDLSGNDFVLVEIAGLQKEEIRDLIASKGKFEARILNQTAFSGGDDITYVCRSADCSGIDPQFGCQAQGAETLCSFFFTITLSPEAAQRQASLTQQLDVVTSETGSTHLSEPIELYLDDTIVDTLQIGASLKGRAETNIQITGNGVGANRDQATTNALTNMHQLQAILETGSLPVDMEIVKIDSLSPVLGSEFLKNALFTGLVALLSVGIVVFARYRKLKVAIPVVLVNTSEVILLLGVSALLGTNMDLAAIAGIIIVVGTGVDHQIMIADELLRKGSVAKQGIKNAFFVIFAAFFTTLVAMIPLWFAGAGILRGFAITTIYGLLIGVLITRPAYASILEYLLKE